MKLFESNHVYAAKWQWPQRRRRKMGRIPTDDPLEEATRTVAKARTWNANRLTSVLGRDRKYRNTRYVA